MKLSQILQPILGCSLLIAPASCSLHNGGTESPAQLIGSQQPSPTLARLDPQMKTVLGAMEELNPKPIISLSPTDARRQPSASDAVIQVIQEKGDIAPDRQPYVGKVEMQTVPGLAGPLPVRIYTPPGNGPFPVVVYFHGGGWVIATIDTYDASCRALTSMAQAVVVSVEYRHAPEAKFPAAHEDCYAAFQYIAAHAQQFGGDPARVAVAGESAGGNLATAVCLMAKDRQGRMPMHQLLIYPICNYSFESPSYKENADARPLNSAMMVWFFRQYLNSPADGTNKLISPLGAKDASLQGLPPATLITAQIDPLRSEGQAYAAKLKQSGVDVAARTYDGVTHEFFGMGLVVGKAKEAEQFGAQRLRDAFQAAR